MKTEVEKKHELEKYNEELVKLCNDAEKEKANINKTLVSLMKTCEDQRAQTFILEQMVILHMYIHIKFCYYILHAKRSVILVL